MLKTCKMDFLGIRPYITWKPMAFFILFSIGFTYFMDLSFFPMVFAMTMSLMIMTYPFVTGEDSGTERLYRMIGMEDEDTVRGRYLYSIVVFFIATLAALIMMNGVSFAKNGELLIRESLIGGGIYLTMFILYMAIALPIFFSMGYKKAKAVAWLTLVAATLIVIGITDFATSAFPEEVKGLYLWAMNHVVLIVLFGIVFLVLMTMLSYGIALKKFKRRDL
ncbi:ABC-2 transporter permease [Aedoeadaptatus pacaensis]|uniref:ABC-2 transporter permease n=1 Tax=Aedoeadaptatus pacaensis TaxID=1776390 RepID=UPI000838FFA0|nr:ABC-2 transporter permease [Peptoniphilus pacaensis]